MMTEGLLTAALGLGPEWNVTKVDFKQNKQEIHIYLNYDRESATLPSCPTCGKAAAHVHDYRKLTWRHLNFWQHETYLHAQVPRIKCEEGHVKTMTVPWARKGSGYTLLFEALVLELAKGMPMAQAARITGLRDKQLWRIVDWHVRRAVLGQDLRSLRRVGIDETSRRRHHRYVTVFMDLDTNRVVYIAKGKDGQTVGQFCAFLRNMGVDPRQIRDVTCDMSEAFLSGVARYLPDARITLDRFHIVKLLGDALTEVRRREQRTEPCLKGSRFAILRNPNKLSDEDRELIQTIERRRNDTARAYQMKIAFDDFFKQGSYHSARGFLKGWVATAMNSGIEEMVRVATTIRSHWRLIVNWNRTRISNGVLEGFNSLLQAMKSCARGYRSFEFIRTIGYLIGLKPTVNSHSM